MNPEQLTSGHILKSNKNWLKVGVIVVRDAMVVINTVVNIFK